MSTFSGNHGLTNGIRGEGCVSWHASMIQITPHIQIQVAVEPADYRKGIDGLAAICPKELEENPFSGKVFVFRNKRELPSRRWCMTARVTGSARSECRKSNSIAGQREIHQ